MAGTATVKDSCRLFRLAGAGKQLKVRGFAFFVSYGKNPPSLVSSLRSETQLAGAVFEILFNLKSIETSSFIKIIQNGTPSFFQRLNIF
ncbi:hypothetical protein [Methanimicrococcus hongohii]|uniref:hypothetical protein n=1 Tax=Methanimicrococcus hongohii TaxID=3028295 RepID=UPI00292DACD7|nr:hypothetical protein [Methanimicrococcus sp. Hf6]